MWKRAIRWSIAWSSQLIPVWTFAIGYQIAISLATLVLGSFKSVQALYLCSGCAKNDITPGISDIDLQIIISDDSNEKPAIERAFKLLSKLTVGVVDFYPSLVYTVETLEHRWQTAPAWQYRYKEAATSWRLLHGRDLIATLQPLTEAQRRTSCYVEMNRWWLLFSERLIKSDACRDDVVLRNVICFKVVAELLKLKIELETRQVLSRKQALTAIDLPLTKKLLAYADKKFLVRDDGLMDETLAFLTDYFACLWKGFPARPFLQVYENVTQVVDSSPDDLELTDVLRQSIRDLSLHICRNWGDLCTGTHIVKSAFFDLDAVLFIADLKGPLPEFAQLVELVQLHKTGPAAAQLFVFLRTQKDLAFPLTPQVPDDLHRCILTPATMPDVFLQLGVDKVCWTDFTQWYLCQWSSNERWPSPPAEKKFQLNTIAQSVRRQEILYPLTIRALNRETRRLRSWQPASNSERTGDVLQTR